MMGTLSAPSPLPKAGNSTLYCYRPPENFPSVRYLLNDNNISEALMHPVARTVCQVCLLYFCRISEVLSLTFGDIIHPDRAVCTGAKRGRSYAIYLPGLSQQVLTSSLSDISIPLFPISYLQCYRSYLKSGIRLNIKGSKNVRRCHLGRYKVADLFDQGLEVSILGDLLHHKSKSSILYYLNR